MLQGTQGYPGDDRFWAPICDCKYPYYGQYCDEVASMDSVCVGTNPCLNGGTCSRRQYHQNWNWDNIGNPPTQGGGGFYTTTDTLPSPSNQYIRSYKEPFQCICPVGYYGDNCELTTNPTATCTATTCQNGGTCMNLSNGPVCACPCGYAGDTCEITAVNRLINGVVGIGARMDFCSAGVNCQNGGTCLNTPEGQGFSCACKSGWGGTYCTFRGLSAAASVTPSLFLVALCAGVLALFKN